MNAQNVDYGHLCIIDDVDELIFSKMDVYEDRASLLG